MRDLDFVLVLDDMVYRVAATASTAEEAMSAGLLAAEAEGLTRLQAEALLDEVRASRLWERQPLT